MIYFIGIEGLPYVKIGYTCKTANRRLKVLEIGCPFPLEVVRAIRITGQLERPFEKAFHRHFKKFHFRGEWYEVTPEQIDAAIQKLLPISFHYENHSNCRCALCRF